MTREGDNGLGVRDGWPGVTIAAALALAACNPTTDDPIPTRIVEVQVPVAVSCVPAGLPDFQPFTVSRDALILAPDAATRYQLAVAGMLERDARSAEVEPVIAACRAAPGTDQ